MKPPDPRVVRTRQMLRDALIALVLEKGYDDITIQEIAEKAGLRRATFYLHYRDKEELMLGTLRETFDELSQQMDKHPQHILKAEHDPTIPLVIFKHAQANANLYRTILSSQSSSVVMRYTHGYIAADIRRDLDLLVQNNPNLSVDLLAHFAAGVTLNLVTWWLDNGMPFSPEQMADTCTRLVRTGLHGMLHNIGATIG